SATAGQPNVLHFIYWLGLLLLMFLSGAETQQLFTREERREVGWLTIVGTGIPFALALVLGPWLVRPSLAGPNGNPAALIIMLSYCVVAGALDVSLVFAAFLAGFAVVHKKRRIFAEALDAIGKFSFAVLIPVYFALVGLKLDLIRGVSLGMIAAFLLGSCAVK